MRSPIFDRVFMKLVDGRWGFVPFAEIKKGDLVASWGGTAGKPVPDTHPLGGARLWILEVERDAVADRDLDGGGYAPAVTWSGSADPPTADELRAAFAAAAEHEAAERRAMNEGIPLMIESVVELDPDRGSGGVRRL